MDTGETSALQAMSSGYYVTFFSNEREKPVFFTREEAIEGMNKSLKKNNKSLQNYLPSKTGRFKVADGC